MLRSLSPIVDPRVLVGAASADDAAVYQVADELAIVATVDYITPVVDDPFTWGAIAAANAFSDIYAMGARPLFALNVVNFPRDTLGLDVLERVLQGGSAKATEAGVPILGGHSIDDPEPKYGMVVIGSVHPQKAICNVGAVAGDALILTKPLGIGMITTALKRGEASAEAVAAAVSVMSALNRVAGETISTFEGVHAATDVTGFGLLGHLSEMLGAGTVGVRLEAHAVPVIPDARAYARQGFVAGGTRRNLAAVEPLMVWHDGTSEDERLLLTDAQTSGGLLIAVEAARCDVLLEMLHGRGIVAAARIGFFDEHAGRITVSA